MIEQGIVKEKQRVQRTPANDTYSMMDSLVRELRQAVTWSYDKTKRDRALSSPAPCRGDRLATAQQLGGKAFGDSKGGLRGLKGVLRGS